MDTVVYTHTMILFRNKKELLIDALTEMTLKTIVLIKEVRQKIRIALSQLCESLESAADL